MVVTNQCNVSVTRLSRCRARKGAYALCPLAVALLQGSRTNHPSATETHEIRISERALQPEINESHYPSVHPHATGNTSKMLRASSFTASCRAKQLPVAIVLYDSRCGADP